jgi:hypothetical protein
MREMSEISQRHAVEAYECAEMYLYPERCLQTNAALTCIPPRSMILCRGAIRFRRLPILLAQVYLVIVELSAEAALSALRAASERIVARHAQSGQHLEIGPEALRAAVSLTGRYVKTRQQSDKVIDALDMACAQAVVRGLGRVGGRTWRRRCRNGLATRPSG